MAKRKAPAIAYLRTSSAANVGADKDSDKRQAATIAAFAKRSHFEIVDTFYDEAVSGADPIETRPGFAALLDRIEDNGVQTVIVEDASRFARERIRKEKGKCEGRKSRVERKPEDAEVVAKAIAMAKRLRRANPKTGKRLSLRKISATLADAGLLNERGVEYNHNAIRRWTHAEAR